MQATKTIKLQEYETKLNIILTDNVRGMVNKLYKKHNIKEKYKDHLAGFMLTFTMDSYYILFDINNLTYNTINHEIFHLTLALTSDRSVFEEEQRALTQGYVSQLIYDFLKEKKANIG